MHSYDGKERENKSAGAGERCCGEVGNKIRLIKKARMGFLCLEAILVIHPVDLKGKDRLGRLL